MIGTLFEHQKIKVTRYDTLRQARLRFRRTATCSKHGWVKTADLCN